MFLVFLARTKGIMSALIDASRKLWQGESLLWASQSLGAEWLRFEVFPFSLLSKGYLTNVRRTAY